VKSQTKLLDVVSATHPACRLASGLDGWEEQADQHTDDCNHNQQFDQSKTSANTDVLTASE
jgi:hypothetical protein